MQRVMLIYPPGKLYQRGEDRSQGNVDDSTSTSIRACNDLGYAAAALKRHGFAVYLRDFQTERLTEEYLLAEFARFDPHVLLMSITNATIFHDLHLVAKLKERKKELVVVLKGALFFDPEPELLAQLALDCVDYLIGGESDFIVDKLVAAHYATPADVAQVHGILYRREGVWCKTQFSCFDSDLDSLIFPDRSLMRNDLYVRPDTGEPQATIATSRGCSAACIYCLTPMISGTKIRLRSPENIVAELRECFHTYHISNFFFKSDTFTYRKEWVQRLCEEILRSELAGKIQWVANSRTRPLDAAVLQVMKKAGCWLVAFGFESGSPETLFKVKKGATLEDNLAAASFAREAGLKIFGFYLVGFPWESMSHLQATQDMIFAINADFIELHLAIPYYGTPLYKMAREEGLITGSILGRDYFNPPAVGTKFLRFDELVEFRKKLLLRYHARPAYLAAKIRDVAMNPKVLWSYMRFGKKLIQQVLA